MNKTAENTKNRSQNTRPDPDSEQNTRPDPDSHGVVEVSDDARRLARRGVLEAGVVGVAEDPLQPGQRSCRRHRLVGKMTCRQRTEPGQ